MVIFADRTNKRKLSQLREAFEESDLPFEVDAFLWELVPENFRPHILESYVVLQEKQSTAVPYISLKECCLKIGSGSTPRGGSSVYLKEGDTYFIRSQNIYNDKFDPNGLVFISEDAAEKLKNVALENGDILLNITGDSVARVNLVPDEYLPARVNQHVAIIRPNPDEFDARYLRYVLSSPLHQSHLLTLASAGATRNALTKGMIEPYLVPKPLLSEQVKIANLLSAFDQKIALNRQINQTLEQMAQTLFKSWFVDFDPVIDNALDAIANGQNIEIPESLAKRFEARKAVRASECFEPLPVDICQLFPYEFEESELGFVPKGWLVEGLSNYITFSNGKARKNADEGTYPLYGANGIIGFSDEAKFNDAIIIGRVGAYCGAIEYCHSAFWGSDNTIVAQAKKEQQLAFILYLLKYLDLNKYAGGAAQPLLNQKVLNGLKFSFSSDLLIKKFTDIITINLEKIVCNNTENDNLEHLRDTLLPKLISGELRLDSPQGEALQQAVSAE
ncbi:restriction endonuclease subunit S [Aliivibrio fischeri]|nr:restriction endonuclease subunit S [Aliivibrio fischeri]